MLKKVTLRSTESLEAVVIESLEFDHLKDLAEFVHGSIRLNFEDPDNVSMEVLTHCGDSGIVPRQVRVGHYLFLHANGAPMSFPPNIVSPDGAWEVVE
jgi:hypothetical protein